MTIRNVVLLALISGFLAASPGCRMIRSVTQSDRSAKVNKRIEKKHQKKYEEAREKSRERHYQRQSERTQKRMDYNARKAEEWRERNMNRDKPSIFERIGDWLGRFFDLFKSRDKGLFND
jgi:predicted Holliday junction resolvase-like endonuclease